MSKVFGSELRRKSFEVHFTGHHVPHLPWTYLESEDEPDTLSCKELSHVTHNAAASEIASNDEEYYVFKPRAKTGKNRSSYRSTFAIAHHDDSFEPDEDTEYFYVNEDETVLPGSYIWWSPSLEENNFSFHGNRKFAINLTKLLQCYQESVKSRYDTTLPDIHFRCGGTLRYNKQACKVLIVCPVDCPSLENCDGAFPPLNMGIGLGDLTQREIVPKLSYESFARHRVTYAFALYYPHEFYTLKCPKNIVTFSEIQHETNYCSGKEYDWYKRRLLCPNVSCPNLVVTTLNQPTKRKREEEGEREGEVSSSKRFAAAEPLNNKEEKDTNKEEENKENLESNNVVVLEPQQANVHYYDNVSYSCVEISDKGVVVHM